MKKDLIFAPIMLLIGVLLFLLRATGMTAHIVISVIGVLALITGIVIMNVHGIVALAVIHKVSAVLFMALIIVLLIHKAAMNKRINF